MNDSPNKSDSEISQELGDVLIEHRVSRIVVALCWLLTIFFCGMSFFGIAALVSAALSGDNEFLSDFALLILALILIAAFSLYFTLCCRRAQFQVRQRGLINQTAFQYQEYYYNEIEEMKMVMGNLSLIGKTLNPLKPHLKIAQTNKTTRPIYLCPFLISNFKIYDVAISTWKSRQQ